MPELPEVEIVRRGLEPALCGQKIAQCAVFVPALRYPLGDDFVSGLTGARVLSLHRRGKYMLLALDRAATLVWHLGMSGRVRIYTPAQTPEFERARHDHVLLYMESGALVVFNDPRRFGFMCLRDSASVEHSPPFAAMGPEPLGNGFHGTALRQALQNRKTPIKQALLDQGIVAGVGNIYACEALYMAGIDPRTPAGAIGEAGAELLAQAVRSVLTKAIAAGGSTLKDHRQTDGSLGYFQHQFGVYDREGAPCPDCVCDAAQTGGVRRIVQGGRSTFYCPQRQK